MKLNVAVERSDSGREKVVITDENGASVPNIVFASLQMRRGEPSRVTVEIIIDRKNVTMGPRK